MRLSNIRLLVRNFDDCFRFWSELIGAKVTWGKPGDAYAHFVLPGGGDIAIFDRDVMAETLGTGGLPQDVSAQDKLCIVVDVDNVDEIHERLVKQGATFTTKPKDMQQWGIRTAHMRDPAGNLIEFCSQL